MQIVKIISLYNESVDNTTSSTYIVPPIYPSAKTLWDADAYGGTVEVYFEAILYSTSTATTANCSLYTAAGSAVTGAEVSTNAVAPTAVRSGNIAANLVDGTDYEIRLKRTGTSAAIYITAARLYIVQSGTITATETQIEIGNSLSTDGVTSYPSFVDAEFGGYFKYDSTKYNGTVNIYFEATFLSPGAGYTFVRLAKTDGTAVASSEVTTNSATRVRVRSGAITLVNGTSYKVQISSDSDTTYGDCYSGRIIIQQTNSPTLTETYYPIVTRGGVSSTTTAGLSILNQILWDDDAFDVTSMVVLHEVTLQCSTTARTAYADLYDTTITTDLDTRSTTATSKTLLTSGSLTMADNDYYITQIRISATTATVTLYGSHLILQLDITAAAGGATYPGYYSTTGWF